MFVIMEVRRFERIRKAQVSNTEKYKLASEVQKQLSICKVIINNCFMAKQFVLHCTVGRSGGILVF